MSDTEWKDTLLQSLEQRDEREQVAPEVYEACTLWCPAAANS